MAARPTLALPQTSARFEMERAVSANSPSSSSESLTERRPNVKLSEPPKPRFSNTTLKYAQMPLPTPPDSAGLMEGYKLQLTLMPPTPGQAPSGYSTQVAKARRKSQVLPYLLTVEDVEDQTDRSGRDSGYTAAADAPPVPPLSPTVTNMSKNGSKRKSSRLSIQTSAADLMKEFNPETAVVPKPPATTSLIVLNDGRRMTMQSEGAMTNATIPMTPITPKTPISPSLPLAKAIRSSGLSLAERRALAKSGAKVPAPLASPVTNEDGERLPTSPPPLTSRSAVHVEAGRLATPRTATPRTANFNNIPKPEVSTPRSATFAVLPAPPSAALPTPRSAAMFSPTRTQVFGPYIPHQNVPVAQSPAKASFASPKSATFSPRSIAFSPIHEDVDREKLRTPTAVNMLVERAQESQQGFVSGLMSPVVLNQFQSLWNVANGQMIANQTFSMGMFREDSFTFTGAEHFTFGADASAAFYRLSAHPSHQQDALFSDLKIHRSNPATQFEVPVIHLQLEAPTLEASGVVALIYPQVAGMVEDRKYDIKKNPKFDVGDEAECCRLVYEPGKGFALFHPAKDEEGGWLNVVVNGRVGFDVIGADGSISICSSTHDEPLVTLDFGTAQLSVNTAACSTINSFYIVDVAAAAVMTVATVEGRRLRAIQEDLDQILAYELATSPDMNQLSPQAAFKPTFDYSFAAAVGRKSEEFPTRKRTGGGKKKSGVGKTLDDFIRALVRFLKSLSGKKQKKSRKPSVVNERNSPPPAHFASPRNDLEEFEFPFQRQSPHTASIHSRNNSYPTVEVNLPRPPSAAYVKDRASRDLSTHH
ncbi:hypothetical protein TWF102_010752 [Orbilia oligospora]|uniref:Uncharacterized protein n=1 Tax=Orbilia oligospora TaxID=2813651 RepID=A0A7C8NFD0_ORBOL|nr:hypothetical protein TWF706_006287 [Orbilia oligospora]KAF3108629.1 hypothetical protein TWF102_010752 [Orbilia oligospora]KAF3111541.1 hypothetical protein TWF103_003488 [Orbilia oligospora]